MNDKNFASVVWTWPNKEYDQGMRAIWFSSSSHLPHSSHSMCTGLLHWRLWYHLRRDAILPTRLTQIGKLWQHIKLLTLYISRSDSELRWLTRIDNGMTAAESVIPGYMLVRMPWGWQSRFNHDSGMNYVTRMVMSMFFRCHGKNFSFLSISLHSYQFAGRS